MKYIQRVLLMIILGVMINIGAPPHTNASEFNFSVTTLPSKNQLDTKNTYFDLLLKPKQADKLQVALRNDTDKEVSVDISVNSATTNSNVVVEYGINDIKKDPSLAFDIKELVAYPNNVVLKPHTEQLIDFNVIMPEQEFDGVLAGGITFKENLKDDVSTNKEQGLSIKNEYSYVVALLMRQNTKEVEPNLQLDSVTPDQINARNVIMAHLINDKSTYINQVVIETQVLKKGKSDILYEETKENGQIAPNTRFSFPTSLKGEKLEPGKYTVKMKVYGNESEDGTFLREKEGNAKQYKNYWELEKDFEIEAEIAKELNEKDVSIKEEDNTKWFILLGIIILSLVIIIVWLISRKKKDEKEHQ